jgi:hypothetical protein
MPMDDKSVIFRGCIFEGSAATFKSAERSYNPSDFLSTHSASNLTFKDFCKHLRTKIFAISSKLLDIYTLSVLLETLSSMA